MLKLQVLFAQHRYKIFVSEMQWSIREEESKSMETSVICMHKLTNCQMNSAGLNYVWLLCQKYRYHALPKTIPEKEFENLVAKMEREKAVLVRKCYKLDTRSIITPEELKPPLPVC